MTKAQKIESLGNVMTVSKRDDGSEYTHFTDSAPEELKDLFLEHYQVENLDYEIFSRACDIVGEIYTEEAIQQRENRDGRDNQDRVSESIYEMASDSASYYTYDRLAYITPSNEDEVSETMREYGEHSIATAAAIWYDRQVEQAAIIINDWINA